MLIRSYKHPLCFYLLCTVIPWFFWFIAAYLSHLSSASDAMISGVLGIIGLASPAVIAFVMMRQDPELRYDILPRLFSFKKIKPVYLFLTCFLMLGSILLAQGISLLFGYSSHQFAFSEHNSFTYNLFSGWIMLFLAPVLEEFAWHSYGTDALRKRYNLFTTSLVFALFWALWHVPLAFIKNYYQSNLIESGWIYSMNFIVSLVPFVLLMNWLYYKTKRNITVAIIFHITAGLFNEFFATHPMSKVIQTILLLGLTAVLVYKEPKFFFSEQYSE